MWYSINHTLVLVLLMANVKLSGSENEMSAWESQKFKQFIKEEYEQIMGYLTNEMEEHLWNREYTLYLNTLIKMKRFMSVTYKKILKRNITAEMYNKKSKFHREFKRLELVLKEADLLSNKSFQQTLLFNVEILLQRTTCLCPYENVVCDPKSEGLDMRQVNQRFGSSRDLNELIYYWRSWREEAVPFLKTLFIHDFNARMGVALKMGYRNILSLDVAKHDSFTMLQNMDELWEDVRPLYDNLHGFAVRRLQSVYPALFQNKQNSYIPAHVLGKNYDSDWMGIYQMLQPYESSNIYTLSITELISNFEYNKSNVFVMADLYYQSFGFESILDVVDKTKINQPPEVFRFNDQFYSIVDGSVVNENDFFEMFDLWMTLCYKFERKYQSVTFRTPPNQVIEDAIKHCVMVQLSDLFFKDIGFKNIYKTSEHDELNLLFKLALKYLAEMAYGYTVDKWRMDVYSGNVNTIDLNKLWWKYRMKYQKVKPPAARTLSNFDPGGYAEYTLKPDHTSHFLATLLTFQFHRALCVESGQYYPNKPNTKPLHKCDLYGSEVVSTRLKTVMSLGSSQHWSKIVKMLTGDTTIRADAIFDYFKPLKKVFDAADDVSDTKQFRHNFGQIQHSKKREQIKYERQLDKIVEDDRLLDTYSANTTSYRRNGNFTIAVADVAADANAATAPTAPATIIANTNKSLTGFFFELDTKSLVYLACILLVFIFICLIAFCVYTHMRKKKRRESYDTYNSSFPFLTYPILNNGESLTRRFGMFCNRFHRLFTEK